VKKTLLAILALVVLGALYMYFKDYFLFERKTAASVLKAYQLYTAQEKQADVTLYFGDPASDKFKTAGAKIYETRQMVNQAKQAILALLQEPPQGCLRVIPEGAMLRDAYLDQNNILYADFTQEISVNHTGGSTAEYLTVYSILNTIFANFPWVKGVRILVDGKETETLAGHVSLEGIFRPEDISYTKKSE
jgi:spore germination protein GerM